MQASQDPAGTHRVEKLKDGKKNEAKAHDESCQPKSTLQRVADFSRHFGAAALDQCNFTRSRMHRLATYRQINRFVAQI